MPGLKAYLSLHWDGLFSGTGFKLVWADADTGLATETKPVWGAALGQLSHSITVSTNAESHSFLNDLTKFPKH